MRDQPRQAQRTRPLPHATNTATTRERQPQSAFDFDVDTELRFPAADDQPRHVAPSSAVDARRTRAVRGQAQPKPARARKPMQDATLFALVACVVGAIGIIYLLQTSEVASLGYRVSELERERAALTTTNQQLSYDTAMREALPAIEQRAEVLGMQPISELIYLDVPAPLETELALPTAEVATTPSLLERLKARLLDESSAADSDVAADTDGGAP